MVWKANMILWVVVVATYIIWRKILEGANFGKMAKKTSLME